MSNSVSRAVLVCALGLVSGLLHAHDVEAPPTAFAWQWSFDPWVLACLFISAALYALGVTRLWRHAGTGRGVHKWQVAAFVAGWLVLIAALVSPLDGLGTVLFSAHMIQHELLMVLAAPLLVLSRPLAAWTWAFKSHQRRALGRATRQPLFALLWRRLTQPFAAWLIHALALWLWHVPQLFNAALRDNDVHTLQHFSFLASALLFWWAVLGRDARQASGAAMLYLFTTMIHTGLLGALLSFSTTVWYAPYIEPTLALGFEPLGDQQLGGLIMWVPAGAAYLVAALALIYRWLLVASADVA